MADQQQNGKPQVPQVPEGELYLFVRLNPKTNEFSCLFSDLLGGLALIPLAAAYISGSMMQPAQPAIASAAGPLGSMIPHFRKGPGN